MWCKARWEDPASGRRQGVETGPEPLRRPIIFDPRRGSPRLTAGRNGPRVSPGATHVRPARRGSFPRRRSPCWKSWTCDQEMIHQRTRACRTGGYSRADSTGTKIPTRKAGRRWVAPGASPGFVAPIIVGPRPARRVEGGVGFEKNATGYRPRDFGAIPDPPRRPIIFDPRRGSPRLTAGRNGPRVSPGATHVRPACRGSLPGRRSPC